MARPIQSETRDLWHSTRAGGAQDTGADRSAPASGPTDAEHFASVYGRYGEVYVAGGSGPDLLNASFWGDDGGDTFSGITGGVGSGNLANGYSGKFTNNYGGSIQFVGMEQFNVSTGKHDDNFKVGDGDDTVNSGAGNDTIDSGKGVDVIFGGDNTGYDRWIADKGFATDAIVIDFTANTAQSYLGTGQVFGIESIFLKTGSGNDVIIGYAAEFNANSINTGAGDDQVTVGNYGRYGDNTVVGGLGTDTLTAIFTGSGPNGGDTFGGYTGGVTAGNFADGYAGKFQNGYGGNFTFSGIEHFSVTTGAANDTFKTGDGDDTVTSNGGDDSFDTGKGIDVVDGGIGTDRWTADKSFATQNINLNITLAGPQAYLGTGSVNSIESLFLKTGAGNDKITAYVSGLDNAISTGDGDDQITLGLYGRYGTDFVAGGEGSDRMTFTWTGDGGGDTFGQVTGGITAGKLNKGYAGALTNSYGGNLTFTGIETFRITTGLQNDNIKTGDGNDTVDTGAGNDAIDSGGGADVVRGGDGTDYWIANKALVSEDITVDLTTVGTQTYMTDGTVSGIEALNLTTGSGDDVVRTLQAELGDTVNSGRGNDLVTLANSGRYGNDSADGGLGSDRLVVLNTGDVFAGLTGGVTGGDLAGGYSGLLNSGYGTTFTFAGFENFSFITGVGDDHMTSGDGKDLLDSREGNDVLDGAGGADTLIGGAGHDTLTGGAGNDIFRYLAVADSAPGLSDYLADFVEGADRIDFAAIDAKSGTPQDNAFSFIGTAAFTHHAGELRYSSDGAYTYVQGDVNGDGTVDIEVLLGGVHTLAGGDFVL